MRTAMPPITEQETGLKPRLRHEHDSHQRLRLQMPYQIFVAAFAAAFPDSRNLLVLDSSGAHTAQRRTLSANVRLVFLPPYCPELNPIEWVWRARKDALAWLHFPTLDVQQDYMATLLRGYEAATRQALTGHTDLVEVIHALCP